MPAAPGPALPCPLHMCSLDELVVGVISLAAENLEGGKVASEDNAAAAREVGWGGLAKHVDEVLEVEEGGCGKGWVRDRLLAWMRNQATYRE